VHYCGLFGMSEMIAYLKKEFPIIYAGYSFDYSLALYVVLSSAPEDRQDMDFRCNRPTTVALDIYNSGGSLIDD
jgi:hypothetical protein